MFGSTTPFPFKIIRTYSPIIHVSVHFSLRLVAAPCESIWAQCVRVLAVLPPEWRPFPPGAYLSPLPHIGFRVERHSFAHRLATVLLLPSFVLPKLNTFSILKKCSPARPGPAQPDKTRADQNTPASPAPPA